MAHTSGSHKPRRRTSSPRESSRQSTGTTNDGRTRPQNPESPYGDYRSVRGRPDRSKYGGSGRTRPTTSSTAIRSPPRGYLPRYPCDPSRMGMTAYVSHEEREERRQEGSRRLSIDVSYGREATTTIGHICIDKPGDAGWFQAIGLPRVATEDRRTHGKNRSIPKVSIVDDRRTYVDTPARQDVRGRKMSRREEGGPGGFQSNDGMPEIRGENLQSYTESTERGYKYQRSHQKMSSREEAATTTRRHGGSTTKRKANDSQGSRLPIYDAHSSPARTESLREMGDMAVRSSSQGYMTRETATQSDPCVGDIDSAFKDDFRSPDSTSEPTDEKRSRPEQTTRRSSNKHPSRTENTGSRGHPPNQHSRPDGSTYSYRKSKQTTTYRSGCCTIL